MRANYLAFDSDPVSSPHYELRKMLFLTRFDRTPIGPARSSQGLCPLGQYSKSNTCESNDTKNEMYDADFYGSIVSGALHERGQIPAVKDSKILFRR